MLGTRKLHDDCGSFSARQSYEAIREALVEFRQGLSLARKQSKGVYWEMDDIGALRTRLQTARRSARKSRLPSDRQEVNQIALQLASLYSQKDEEYLEGLVRRAAAALGNASETWHIVDKITRRKTKLRPTVQLNSDKDTLQLCTEHFSFCSVIPEASRQGHLLPALLFQRSTLSKEKLASGSSNQCWQG